MLSSYANKTWNISSFKSQICFSRKWFCFVLFCFPMNEDFVLKNIEKGIKIMSKTEQWMDFAIWYSYGFIFWSYDKKFDAIKSLIKNAILLHKRKQSQVLIISQFSGFEKSKNPFLISAPQLFDKKFWESVPHFVTTIDSKIQL